MKVMVLHPLNINGTTITALVFRLGDPISHGKQEYTHISYIDREAHS